MKYDKMIAYFDSGEAGLQKLILDCKDLFDQVDEIGQQLLQGILTTSDDFKSILNILTGIYMILEPIYSLSKTHKTNEELKNYVEKKREAEESGIKVVVAHLDKESSLAVSTERRIRNILEGYVLATEKCIITAQTQLKRVTEDPKFKPQEEV